MQFIESPNCWQSRRGYAVRWIVLHGTAGGTSAANVANWFANPESKVSAHYVVDRDGSVVQCVPDLWAAWANGEISGPAGVSGDGVHHDAWWDNGPNPNYTTLSIEHVKPSDDNSNELTALQATASFKLIESLCNSHGIPKYAADENGGITGHFSIDPVNRSRCPGAYPWEELWQYLGGSMIPQGWVDDGKALTAPNGFIVVRGFRDFILNSGDWPSWNWPVEHEHGQSPLELSHTAIGGGTQQCFRRAPLGWTPAMGVFEQWTGPEILALRARIAELEAMIAKLTPPPLPPASSQQPPMPKAS